MPAERELTELVDDRHGWMLLGAGFECGQAGAYIHVIGGEPDPVGEATVELRRRNARLDQQQVRPVEPSETLGVSALLRPSHHDDVVVRCRSQHSGCVRYHANPFTRIPSSG